MKKLIESDRDIRAAASEMVRASAARMAAEGDFEAACRMPYASEEDKRRRLMSLVVVLNARSEMVVRAGKSLEAAYAAAGVKFSGTRADTEYNEETYRDIERRARALSERGVLYR